MTCKINGTQVTQSKLITTDKNYHIMSVKISHIRFLRVQVSKVFFVEQYQAFPGWYANP